jgi:hypothetical protein
MQLRPQVSPALKGLNQVNPFASLLSAMDRHSAVRLWQITANPSLLIQQNLLESENLLNLLPQTRVEGPLLKVQIVSTSCPDRKFPVRAVLTNRIFRFPPKEKSPNEIYDTN